MILRGLNGCRLPDVLSWRTATTSEICAINATKMVYVVDRLENDSFYVKYPVKEVCNCLHKIRITSENETGASDIFRLNEMMIAAVDTLDRTSHSVVCSRGWNHESCNNHSIGNCANGTVSRDKRRFDIENLKKGSKFFGKMAIFQ